MLKPPCKDKSPRVSSVVIGLALFGLTLINCGPTVDAQRALSGGGAENDALQLMPRNPYTTDRLWVKNADSGKQMRSSRVYRYQWFVNGERVSIVGSHDSGIWMFGESLFWLPGENTKVDLKKFSKHNTYMINGLPETPICNPGKDSLLAADNPSETNFLFYVANGKGGHAFSQTLEQHNKNVRIWREIIKDLGAD